MAGNRTLKLSILADVDDLKNKLNIGASEVEGFGSKLGDFGKKAAAAFAVAGAAAAAYAGKLLVDGVKSAIEDEKAQESLAATLRNVTDATKAQIGSVEKYIYQTSIAKGITDDQLRPSLDRLLRSTNDVTKAQELQTLALDISAGSGKSLETVSAALAKAYDGNISSLSRLGIGLSSAELKTMTFDQITAKLADTFENQASTKADTFAGKLDRLKIAFEEGKETVGSFVLDAITPMVTFILDKVVPTLNDLSEKIGKNLKPTFDDFAYFFTNTLIPTLKNWWIFLSETVIPGIIKTVKPIIEGLFDAWSKVAKTLKDNEANLQPFYSLLKTVASFIAKTVAPAIGTVLGTALKVVGTLISGLIAGFAKLVDGISNFIEKIKQLIALIAANPLVQGIGDLIGNIFGGGRATGGAVNSNTSYMVGERGPEMFVPNSSGRIIPTNRLGGQTININVSGAIDPISTARQIAEILNSEAATAGTFTSLGISRFATRNI